MEIIEFHTTVKNGIIEIPSEYKGKLKSHVRVILMPEGRRPRRRNIIDRLLTQPIRVKGFQPITREDIYDR